MMRIISGYFWWTVPLCVFISVLTVLVVARGGSLWASHRKYSVLSSQACIITQRKTFPQLSSAKLHHWAPARQERVSASSRSLHEALSLVLISCVLYRKEIVLFLKQSKGSFFFSSVGLWLRRWCSCFTHILTSVPLKVPLLQSHRVVTLTLSLHAYILQILWSVYIVTYIPYFLYLISSLSFVFSKTVAFTFYKWNKQSLFTKVSLPGLFLTAAGWFEMYCTFYLNVWGQRSQNITLCTNVPL